MTDRGDVIAVEATEAERELPSLLKAVEEGGRTVRIFRDGRAIADLARSPEASILPVYPELAGVIFNEDPAAPLTDEDWPEAPARIPDPLVQHPEISQVWAAEDAFAPADEQDWPSECR